MSALSLNSIINDGIQSGIVSTYNDFGDMVEVDMPTGLDAYNLLALSPGPYTWSVNGVTHDVDSDYDYQEHDDHVSYYFTYRR